MGSDGENPVPCLAATGLARPAGLLPSLPEEVEGKIIQQTRAAALGAGDFAIA